MAFTRVVGPGIHTASNINSHNINSTGIITAVSFVGDGSGLTGINTDFIVGTAITMGTANFTGNVTIGGTLTYEDVKNIDSVGIITARSDLNVDGHTNLDNVSIAGVTTFNDNVRLLDGDRLQFGNSQDISIFHNGSHTMINKSGSGTGDLIFNIDQVIFKDTTGSDERLSTNSKGI